MSFKITIDPGHGKNGNKSPNNTKYIEGTQMWHLANKLKTALEKYGFEVLTTRPNITDNPSLSARGKMAGNNDCCLFLSLHSNAPGKSADGTYSKSVTGTVVYYSMTDSENKVLADRLGNKVSELMGHYFRGSLTRQYPNKPGVDYYGVIRAAAQSGCKCAMLIEHGFHTNINDSNFLLVDANLEKIANAEAEIIANYFGQKAQTDTAQPPAETPTTPAAFNVGDVVNFKGNVHYTSANAANGKACKSGKAKITQIYQLGKAKHPYHLVRESGGATVWGWVDKKDVSAITATAPAAKYSPAVGDTVKINSGVTAYSNGVKMPAWVRSATLYIRQIEKNGTILLVSTEKTKKVYTGRVKASDVHKA